MTVTVTPLIPRANRHAIDELTRRELQILCLIARGYSNAAMCEALHLSTKTVEAHVRNVYRKLGLLESEHTHRRVLAVLMFLEIGAERRFAA